MIVTTIETEIVDGAGSVVASLRQKKNVPRVDNAAEGVAMEADAGSDDDDEQESNDENAVTTDNAETVIAKDAAFHISSALEPMPPPPPPPVLNASGESISAEPKFARPFTPPSSTRVQTMLNFNTVRDVYVNRVAYQRFCPHTI